jgi:hypothetical protein
VKIGFGKADITPRIGVELCGFGPYIQRRSVAVRDRLWARAMAVEQGGYRLALVSCDLVGVSADITRRVRELASEQIGLPPECLMVHGTHTHSGPNTGGYTGWGEADAPYLEILPQRIARACVEAVANLQEAQLRYAETPCVGIGLNREYDNDAPPLADVLREDWRPAKPDLTDTTCHVLKIEAAGSMIGFASSFGCHPVVCCSQTHSIHGDYCGVATNLLERECPGSVGLFLQGAQGDVNSCVVHKPEMESLLALDVIAARYARAVRRGLAAAAPVRVDSIGAVSRQEVFSRKPLDIAALRRLLAEQEATLRAPDASDSDSKVRMATVAARSLRGLVAAAERGESLSPPLELQGFRIGPLLVLASPFETFQAIKNDVRAGTGVPATLVLGITNDTQGYAPDRTAAARGGYAADTAPLIVGRLPYAAIHDELVAGLLSLARDLCR